MAVGDRKYFSDIVDVIGDVYRPMFKDNSTITCAKTVELSNQISNNSIMNFITDDNYIYQ